MDDASSALIAKLLAEDQEYALASGYFEEEEDYEDEEDDYRKRRSKKRKKTSSKRENKENSVREQVNKKSKEGQDAGETVEEEKKKKRLTPRRWTEEEESLFEQGLERFGRDWRSISALLNHSRRPRDVASHAQKHFIKLFKEKLPLPAKVRESGEGYTLSGKPLDPQSAAAKAYGGAATSKAYRQQNQNKKSSSAALLQLNQHHNTPSSEQQRLNHEETSFKRQETVEPLPVSQQSLEELQDRDDGKGHTILADAKLLCDLSKKKNSQKSKVKKRQQVYGEDGRTEYSRNRSRRRAANKFTSAVEEALQFVPVSSYTGPPLSGPKSQPFQVQVHSSVYATVDLHAHLSTAEVMGFLAGRFNQDKLTITVEKAFPGSSTLNGETECEMDPVVEVNLRAEIVGQGLKVVGWYHSHPTFQPVPSQCDVVNQANYQILFRDEASDSEPFLGLIMSPYDQRLPSPRSQYSWFYVDSPRINKTPKRIESHLLCEASIPCDTKTRMKNLIGKERAQIKTHAVDFNAPWRTGQEGETITFIEKLRASLSFWLPPLVFSVAGQTMSANLAEDQPNEDPNTVLDDVLQSLNK